MNIYDLGLIYRIDIVAPAIGRHRDDAHGAGLSGRRSDPQERTRGRPTLPRSTPSTSISFSNRRGIKPKMSEEAKLELGLL